MSRLDIVENILFGKNHNLNLDDFRYVYHSVLNFGDKIIKIIHKINFLIFAKKYGFIPSNIKKAIEKLANLDINQYTSYRRKYKLNAECINNIINKIGLDKKKYNQYIKISWNNLKIIL